MGRLSRGTIKSGRARKRGAAGGARTRRDATAYQHTRNRKYGRQESLVCGAARRGVPTAHTRGRREPKVSLCVVWNHQAIHLNRRPNNRPDRAST